jgi:hypothetical protein
MPTTTTPEPVTTAPPARGRPLAALLATLLAAVLAAALTLSTLVALPAPLAASADDRAERWAGFRIPSTGRAAGGWIGGYRLDGTPVFVITPGRRPNRAGFRAADATSDLRGPKGPSAAATQRAAWILSKYGGHKDAVQAAAVDAAVLHLLGGRAWQLGARRGAARVRASGDPATVRRYVRLMLRGSRASAGPHEVAVEPSTADVGGVTAVTVRVTDGHGGPVAGLPVTVTSPDGGTSQPVAGPIEAVTGDDGRALVRLAAPLAGWRTVVAEVGQVPLHWLRVRGADRERQASAAEGGVRRTIAASARVAVRGPQSLSLVAARETIAVGDPAVVAATVRGDGTARRATATLFGPFLAASSAECSGASLGSVSTTVAGDGDYAFPSLTPTAGGFYAWRVEVDGAPTSLPATGCGAVVKARGRTAVSVAAPVALPARGNTRVTVTVSGMPVQERVDIALRLYGGSACTTLLRTEDLSLLGNGQIESGPIWLDPGTYTWRAVLSPGELWLGSESTCGASGSTTTVP